MKAITFRTCGIKCDNPKCNFKNDAVKLEDYKYWLNKPCPKCGHNLLTKADYRCIERLVRKVRRLNKLFSLFHIESDELNLIRGHIEMNGTGKAFINIDRS